MDVKQELEKLEGELRAMLPDLAAKRPDLIPRMAATTLADKNDREGVPPCVPCPICGGILQVSRIEIDDGKGGIKGAVGIGCRKGCTSESVNYGL